MPVRGIISWIIPKIV